MENEEGGFNAFSNDGSFMEKFKKLQEEKKPDTTITTPVTRRTPPLRKVKPLIMKVSSLKKKTPPLVKSAAASLLKKSEGSAEKGEGSPSEKETEKQKIKSEEPKKEPNIPLASSIGIATRGANLNVSRPNVNANLEQAPESSSAPDVVRKKRKRSRWSDTSPIATPPVNPAVGSIMSADDVAIATAMASFSESPAPVAVSNRVSAGQHLTPAQLEQVKEQIEMNKLVAQIRVATEQSIIKKKKQNPDQPQYEYDSDEDTEGGTWEHKKRAQEMLATYDKAMELTELGKGKHHIGDYLPPEELQKFLEKVAAIKEGRNPDLSDYKEHKLDESNIGFRLLQKAGWTEGQGLGEKEDGIIDPVNKGKSSFDQAGMGAETPNEVTVKDNPFDTYRKRMMLAYRFRPNPMNNPRRPYY